MSTQPNNPIVSGQVLSANQTQTATDVRALIIAPKLPAGTATADAILENILNDATVWDDGFGEDSVAASMTRAFREVNTGRVQTRLDVVPVDDAAGTKATGEVAVSGTATEDGTLVVNVTSESNKTPYSFSITISNTDTATAVGAAIESALNAEAKLPVTALNTTGTVALTAKHFGTVGNAVGLSISGTVAGLTFTLTGMSGGATDPSLTSAINAIQDKRYQIIMVPSGWDISALKTELESRWVADNKVLDGHLFQAKTDSFANLLSFGNAENSKHTTFMGFEKTTIANEYDAPEFFALDYAMAAYVGGIIAFRLTEDTLIGNILASTVNASRDVFGGSHSASLPFHNTLVSTLDPSDQNGFTDTEIQQLKDAGVSVLGNNQADTAVVLGSIMTANKTDNSGNPDVTFEFLNGKLTDSLVREIFFNNYKATYSQSRLKRGSLKAGYLATNVSAIRAFNNRVYTDLEDIELVDSGAEARAFFDDNQTVEIEDFAAGKVFISLEYQRVGQLRQIDFTVQPNLDA